mmetsp:Transcript_39362/g.57899  ORF Transcript_39362/g.57899 Transcript_39362/m.57899 type:complete len:667 (+) Transcript_39362:207-2207(+)
MAHFGDSEGHSSTSDVSLVDGCWMRVAGNCFAFGLESAPRFKLPRTPSRMDSKIATHSVKEVRDNEMTKPKSESKVQRLGLPSVSKIAAMAAGTDHAVVCLADQTLFSTGSNSFGQLGIGLDGTTQKAFAALDIRLPVVSVACGKAHTIMATLYGEMYSCGNNTSGQLGLGNYEDRLALTRSDLSDYNVMSVAAGDNHTLAVTRRGQLYSFGNNSEGQLGISRLQDKQNRTFCNRNDDLTSTPIPTLIQLEPEVGASRMALAFDVLRFCCGARHSVAIVRTWRMDTRQVISEGELYAWGSNSHGQLGKPSHCAFLGTPRWVQIHPARGREALPHDLANATLPPAKVHRDHCAAMLWYEDSHVSAPPSFCKCTAEEQGQDHSDEWQWAGYGEVPVAKGKVSGNVSGKVSSGWQTQQAAHIKYAACIARSKAPLRIACGAEFTLIVTADGCVYGCGRGDEGQLGVRGLKDRFTPTLLSSLHGLDVTDVACGRQHAFALVDGGLHVYGWGRNREGQLGVTASSHEAVPILLKGISLRKHVDLMSCKTSRDTCCEHPSLETPSSDTTRSGTTSDWPALPHRRLLPNGPLLPHPQAADLPLAHNDDELASIQGSHAFVCAADTFSLFAHIDVDGFPNLAMHTPGASSLPATHTSSLPAPPSCEGAKFSGKK